MVRTSKRKQGTKLTQAAIFDLYSGLFKYQILDGMTYGECAKILGVDMSTISFHCTNMKGKPGSGGFIDWLKKRHPERYDRDFIVHRFIDRSEDRRKDARYEYTKDGVDTTDKARLLKEMREEDQAQLKILQNIGVVEAQSEVHVHGPVTFTWGTPKGEPKSKK